MSGVKSGFIKDSFMSPLKVNYYDEDLLTFFNGGRHFKTNHQGNVVIDKGEYSYNYFIFLLAYFLFSLSISQLTASCHLGSFRELNKK